MAAGLESPKHAMAVRKATSEALFTISGLNVDQGRWPVAAAAADSEQGIWKCNVKDAVKDAV